MVSRVLVCGKNRTWPSIRSTSHPVPPAIYPQYKSGTPNCCMILLQMRFAYAIAVARDAVGSYPAFSPLPFQAVIFCSTFCQAKSYALMDFSKRTTILPCPVITRHLFRWSPDFTSRRKPIIRILRATIYPQLSPQFHFGSENSLKTAF